MGTTRHRVAAVLAMVDDELDLQRAELHQQATLPPPSSWPFSEEAKPAPRGNSVSHVAQLAPVRATPAEPRITTPPPPGWDPVALSSIEEE
jgi:hypothetical protein